MELKRLVKNEDGEVYATWALTPDQFGYLLQFAITRLMEEGIAKVEDISEEELAKLREEAEEEFNLQTLDSIPTEDMGRA